MNVYDFDKTIFKGDSTLDFYFFCIKKNPSLLRYVWIQIFALVKYVIGFITKTDFKQDFFCFLNGIKDIDGFINEFWKMNESKIQEWYLLQKKPDDVIISASPEFLLKPLCEKLNISSLIASQVDKKTGLFLGKNCYGIEKVKRFHEVFPYETVENFYSDSLSDDPFANISNNAYVISKNKRIPWNKFHPSIAYNIRILFFSKQFILFLFIGCLNAFNGIIFAYFFSLVFNPNIAFICGYLISLSISYLLNSILVFREKLKISKYIKFCISYIPNFIIQNICVFVFYNWVGVDKLVTYAIAAIIGIPITFLMIKLFAFAKK